MFIAVSCFEYSHNNIWIQFPLLAVVILIATDMLALPVYKLHGGVELHHLWRVSQLKDHEIKWMRSGTWSVFRVHSKEGEVTIYAQSKRAWTICCFQADQVNGLEAYYSDLGYIKKIPKYEWGMSKPKLNPKDGSDTE